MKKLLFILLTFTTLLTASWFSTAPEENSLAPVPFATFAHKIGKTPMMVEFGSLHCHSCQLMAKRLYKVKKSHPNAQIYFVDLYKNKAAAKRFNIRVIPTQIYINKEGQVVDTHMGAIEVEDLVKNLKERGVL